MKRYLSLLSTVLLASCEQTSPTTVIRDYEDAEHIKWEDTFLVEEKEYLVYYYSTSCGHCREIKNEIINYYFLNVEEMRFVSTDDYVIYGPSSDLSGVNNIDDFYIFGTPFMIRVYDSTLVSYYAGVGKIREYIDSKIQN